MDVVFIVEKEPEEYQPNFTLPDKKDLTASDKTVDHTFKFSKAALLAGAISGIGAPVALVVGASMAIPGISNLLTSDGNEESLTPESVDEFKNYINNRSLTKQQALDRGFQFPPGHPRVGETYRLHPLSNHASNSVSKENLYIPEHIFDSVLFEERESELLTLLVHLGATEVKIAKYIESLVESGKSADIKADMAATCSASVSGKSHLDKGINEQNVRTFSLSGKPWKYGDKLETCSFAWLNFEPSWKALITAREIGGCTSATLEIKEASKYVSNKEASTQIKAKIYSANGTLKFMEKDLKETSYIVNVKFSQLCPE